jgi:hypothetical protein
MREEPWDVGDDADGEGTPPVVRQAAADLRRGGASDERAVAAVMAAVRRRPVPRRSRPAAWRRLTAARTWHLSPLAAAGLAASLVGVGAVGAFGLRGGVDRALTATGGPASARGVDTALQAAPPGGPAFASQGDAAPTHVVRFVLAAPSGSSGSAVSRVTLVGDFNGWNAEATPMRWDAAARAWTTVVALPAGRYVYAFVLDGRRWVADPAAPLAPEDGFGASNSVVVVAPTTGGAT